ncbi:MAG: LPS export ABC transporter periplasmic protein LptC [Methylococcaceae bacterium]|nr:LPS export ABC transporter periplasmic protein LptC [Methylococcaceae bacterium]MCI0667123.1 LPS export ABC transporter periplasmic protein LptC [Methylococcaceae bacterium]MCI0734617.1 LPS export ABC transporter periplasmic protein LptC [Methylococcaceae bacterium]
MTKQLWIYLALTIVVLLSWFVADWLSPQPKKIQSRDSHRPDSFSKKFSKITMTEEGKPKNKLIAESMVHFKDDDTTELEKPVFTYFNAEAPPWVVHSDRGFISTRGETIVLGGKVWITRAAAPGIEPVTINTENLRIKPKTDYAETDKFAELISNRNRISGIGLSLYFGEHKRITLHSSVRGIYDAR